MSDSQRFRIRELVARESHLVAIIKEQQNDIKQLKWLLEDALDAVAADEIDALRAENVEMRARLAALSVGAETRKWLTGRG